MMRRLPVFLLLDVSESMAGEEHYQLESGLREIAKALRSSPYALETAWISVIAFAGKPRTLVPLTEVAVFQPPELPLGGGTCLGAALDHLMDDIDRNVRKTSFEQKGDWRPLVFLLTDGYPTDDPASAIARWQSHYRDRINLTAVSIGGAANHSLLCKLTDDVLIFDDRAPDAFTKLVQWLSASLEAQSRSVQTVGEGASVSLTKSDVLQQLPAAGGPEPALDERFAVVVGKCARTDRPYLMKYERIGIPTSGMEAGNSRYELRTVVPLSGSYFELSETSGPQVKISSGELTGAPPCPHCASPFGLAVCRCGGVHCVKGEGEELCPWCDNVSVYSSIAKGEDNVSMNRGQG